MTPRNHAAALLPAGVITASLHAQADSEMR
jgi:hypothetical protein